MYGNYICQLPLHLFLRPPVLFAAIEMDPLGIIWFLTDIPICVMGTLYFTSSFPILVFSFNLEDSQHVPELISGNLWQFSSFFA